MGWLFTKEQTRKELIERLTATEENPKAKWVTLAKCTKGNILWTVVEYTDKTKNKVERYIVCNMMNVDRGYGWGYKNVSEQEGPIYCSCPLKYLDMVPVPTTADGKEIEYAVEWRKKVRLYHRKLKVGMKVKLKSCSIPYVWILSVKPLLGNYHNQRYRVGRRFIDEILAEPIRS
jgi:hypothetical protein